MIWNSLLREQLTWHWTHQLRDRLDGLTDDEYFWEPVPGCWSVRPGDTGTTIDFAFPQPVPPPFTTIAWRLAHVNVGVLAMRSASHFGRAATGYDTFPYAATANEALAQLDEEYETWLAGVESLGEDGLARPCGQAEGPYAELPMAALVLHIHREMIHHLSEVSLIRDLYLHTDRKAS